MSPEFPSNNPRAELEARLTAFILGELPAHEAAALRQAMDDDAQLADLYEQLQSTIKLVREAAAVPVPQTTESTAPLRLSEDRRQKLLAQFKTIAPKEFVRETKKTLVRTKLLQIAAAVAVLAILASMGISHFGISRHESEMALTEVVPSLASSPPATSLAPRPSPPAVTFGVVSATNRVEKLRLSKGGNPSPAIVSTTQSPVPPALASLPAQSHDIELFGNAGKSAQHLNIVLPPTDGGEYESEVIPLKHANASEIASALGSLGGNTSATIGSAPADASSVSAVGFVTLNEAGQQNSSLSDLSSALPTLGAKVDAPVIVSATGGSRGGGATTNADSGDPEWIGFLKHPEQRHSDSKSFIARSEFLPFSPGAKSSDSDKSKLPWSVSSSARAFYDGTDDGATFPPSLAKPVKPAQSAAQPNAEFRLRSDLNRNGAYDSAVPAAEFSSPAYVDATTGLPLPTDTGADVSGDIDGIKQALSQKPPEINLHAKFAEVTQNDNRALGFNWNLGEPNSAREPQLASGGTQPGFNVSNSSTPVSPAVASYTLIDGVVVPITAGQPKDVQPVPQVTGTYFGGISGQTSSTYGIAASPAPAKLESPRAATAARGSIKGTGTLAASGEKDMRRTSVLDPNVQVETAWDSETREGRLRPTNVPNSGQLNAGIPLANAGPVAVSAGSDFFEVTTNNQFKAATQALEKRDGVDLLTAPEITTESGRQSTLDKETLGKSGVNKQVNDGTNVYAFNPVGYVNVNPTPVSTNPAITDSAARPLDRGEQNGRSVMTVTNGTILSGYVDTSVQSGNRTSGFSSRLTPLGLKPDEQESADGYAANPFPKSNEFAIKQGYVDLRKSKNTRAPNSLTIGAGEAAGTLSASTSTNYLNPTELGDVTITVDPETKRIFYNTDLETTSAAGKAARQNRSNVLHQNSLKIGAETQYVKEEDLSRKLKELSPDSPHSKAYFDKLNELNRLRALQEQMALKAARESVEDKMPTTLMVEVIEHADGKPAKKTLSERIGNAFTGNETQTARIKIERDVTDVPGVNGQPATTGFYDPYFVATELEVIQSQKVLDQVIDRLNLKENWASKKGGGNPLTAAEARQLLKHELQLSHEPNSGLLDIKVKSDKPEEAAKIANTIAEVYQDYRRQQRKDIIEGGAKIFKKELEEESKKVAQVEDELAQIAKTESPQTDVAPAKPAAPLPVPQPEVAAAENPFSTFSLNVSDVSFKLAAASLEKGLTPDPAGIRSEEFINAFDYRDPEPTAGAPLAFAWERARYPFAHNRDLLRFSVKTAAAGREPGRPMNIVLLLDNSGSMERADRVKIIREALRVLATQLQPQDKLSVVTFARTARLWVDGLSGAQAGEVAEGLGNLTPEGGTNLEEAMKLAYATARRHYLANGVNRVVLLTDGAANLGNLDPAALKQNVDAQRKQGIALDCFGIGWEGYNDDLLEVLSRNGDGRYGFINTPEEAASGFAAQLAGALHVAASDVKVQVEFNPARVTSYRQIGYAKHQLTKEQFRDNTVNAAQIGAAESGNALYTVELNPQGSGSICTVHVRYREPGTANYHEHAWDVPYAGNAVALDQSSPAMRLAGAASAFSEMLATSPFAAEVTSDQLLNLMRGVPEIYGADERPKKLEWMIRQTKSLEGK